jgi:UDP-N-acetylglucosamine 4,6-dehydratase/5-epimerase
MFEHSTPDLNGKSVFITGATGSFGKQFTKTLLSKYPDLKRLVVFSRDELKQYEMGLIYPGGHNTKLRYFLGDIRDADRLNRALEGVDVVIHAAALKQVPAAEYNPMEFVKTNVMGAQNLIEACFTQGVSDVVALSTDKAAAPINLYGATKLCSDKLFTAANNIKGSRDIRFSVVRYGNVMGSRGSVMPFFLDKAKTGVLPITDDRMTRFNISLQDGVNLVLLALKNSWGGEIFVPKIPSYRITEVASAIGPNCKQEIVGIRPGEKIHEEMITESDSFNTYDCDDYYAILPQTPVFDVEDWAKKFSATLVPQGFKYNSGNNEEWLSEAEIRNLIIENIDPTFKPL